MKSMVKVLAQIVFFILTSCMLNAQSESPYEIIFALSKAQLIDLRHPMVDSLEPFRTKKFKGKDWETLTKKDKKELKRTVKNNQGYRLESDSLNGKVLIPAIPIFNAFNILDSANLEIIKEKRPFYMMTKPIFFDKNKSAVVHLSSISISGFEYTFILKKKGTEWVVIKHIMGLVN